MALPKEVLQWRITQLAKRRVERYHALEATQEWARFVQAMSEVVERSVAERQQRDEQRRRETTYAQQ